MNEPFVQVIHVREDGLYVVKCSCAMFNQPGSIEEAEGWLKWHKEWHTLTPEQKERGGRHMCVLSMGTDHIGNYTRAECVCGYKSPSWHGAEQHTQANACASDHYRQECRKPATRTDAPLEVMEAAKMSGLLEAKAKLESAAKHIAQAIKELS